MMDTLFSVATACIMLAIMAGLWITGRKESIGGHDGWAFILGGFSLFFIGAIGGIVCEKTGVEQASIFYGINCARLFERGIGDLAGLALVAIGLKRWMPAITALRETEETLELAYTEMEEKVEARTGELAELNEKLNQDIALRTRAEEELRTSEERYRNIIDTTSEGFWELDANLTITTVNDALCRMLGYCRQEIIGKRPFDFTDEENNKIFIEQASRIPFVPHRIYEIVLKAKNGSDVYARVSATTVWDSAGGIKNVFALIGDITPQKNVEARLRESETRFRNLSESAFEGIIVHNTGLILDVNQTLATMTGYPAKELIGMNALELVTHRDRDTVRRNITSNYTEPYEIVALRKDGTEFPVEIHGKSAVHSGVAVRVAAIRDITSQKIIEKELKTAIEMAEEASRIKDKFISLVSHDLRSPLASVTGLLKLIESDTMNPLKPEHKSIVAKTISVTAHMGEMIDRLLDLSRIRMGKIKPRRRFFHANEVVLDVFMNMSLMAEAKRIKLINDTGNPMLYADPELYAEVIRNLVSNAIKFSPIGGEVTVFVPEGKQGALAVRDSGSGIPQEEMENLFKGEKKVAKPGTAGEKGAGLGLLLAREIIDIHSGSIYAVSSEGEGSVFHVEIPHVTLLVMMVVTSPDHRIKIKNCLANFNAEVIEPENESMAIEQFGKLKPHLVITEVDASRKLGYELVKFIKTDEAASETSVLTIVNRDEIYDREFAMTLGVDDYCDNNAPCSEFAHRVKKLLFY